MNPNIDQYTAVVNQCFTMVNPQYTTIPPQYPMNSMNKQSLNVMIMNSVVLNNKRNLFNQNNMNNSQYMKIMLKALLQIISDCLLSLEIMLN